MKLLIALPLLAALLTPTAANAQVPDYSQLPPDTPVQWICEMDGVTAEIMTADYRLHPTGWTCDELADRFDHGEDDPDADY